MRLLIVEDEIKLGTEIAEYLKAWGFRVSISTTTEHARAEAQTKPDLVLLDWRLPDGEGIDLLRDWRQTGMTVPVIMMTARAETIDKVLGLEIGANDYITKPFEPRELLARIRVQIRQIQMLAGMWHPMSDSILEISEIRIDRKKREVWYRNQSIETSKLEFDLLRLFLERPAEVLSRLEIMNGVWGRENYQSTKTIEFHVAALRKKIHPAYFEVVRGIGYMFNPNPKHVANRPVVKGP